MKVKLGTLKEHLTFLLVEGRVEDAREKFPDMEDEDFDFLVANQPGGSNNKYLMWSCKQAETLLENDPDRQALSLVVQAVRLFDGNQQRLKKRDINQYATVSEVETAVQELGKSKGEKAREVRSDTDTVYQDDRFVVVRPYTTEASCKYGVGTRWCIAATGSHNYYTSYSTNNNKFYFVIDKTLPASDPASKFAIAIMAHGQPQVYNAPDKLVPLTTVSSHVGDKWPDMWAKIQAHVKANPTTREVEEAQKATGEFVAALLKDEPVSDTGLDRIAASGKLTPQVIKALQKRQRAYTGPNDYRDRWPSIMATIARRSAELNSEGAMLMLKWYSERGGSSSYNDQYYVRQIVSGAPLTTENFREIVNSNDESAIQVATSNPNFPPELFDAVKEKVAEFQNTGAAESIYWELIKRGNLTPEQFAQGLRKAPYIRQRILQSPTEANISPEIIRMIPIQSAYDMQAVMKLPNVPADYVADAFDKAWKFLQPYELYDIAKTAKFSTDKIEQLWKEKGQDIRTALLQNPAVGPEVAAKFALSKNSAYRFAVAHNPVTPVESLNILSDDESVSTRGAVASNPKTPAETFAKLAKDEAIAVRANVADNKAAPRRIINALLKDSDAFVRKMARKTAKAQTPTESFVHGMKGLLLRESIDDDDAQDIMVPSWREIPIGNIEVPEFVAIFLLQNNGHATREEIETAYKLRYPQDTTTRYVGSRYGRRSRYGGGRRAVTVQPKSLWSILRSEDKQSRWSASSNTKRATHAGGKGWWWATPGVNAGAIYRLTPAGAAAAMGKIKRIRDSFVAAGRDLGQRHEPAPVRKSPPPRELTPGAPRPATAARVPGTPKTTYKIYGKFKGHPAATRLKGKAYVAPRDTQFSAGEQAYITPDGDKLKVKKTTGDHTQTWDPIDG